MASNNPHNPFTRHLRPYPEELNPFSPSYQGPSGPVLPPEHEAIQKRLLASTDQTPPAFQTMEPASKREKKDSKKSKKSSSP